MGHKRVSPKFTHKGRLMFGRNINSTVNYIIAIDRNNVIELCTCSKAANGMSSSGGHEALIVQ